MRNQYKDLKLSIVPGVLAICRLEKGCAVPSWALDSVFFSVNQTPDELSIVCEENLVPKSVKKSEAWRAFKVDGPLDLTLTGVVASISKVLAGKRIPIFVISTYDTDYILVQVRDFDRAKKVLAESFSLSE